MYVLSPTEAALRAKLEQQVLTGFVLRGQALRSIKRLKLYRDRFNDFESYCDEVFGFSMLYIERCMLAAETYYSIEEYLKTNSLKEALPTKQSQLGYSRHTRKLGHDVKFCKIQGLFRSKTSPKKAI
ncbi:MAG: hypothetical protein AAFY63_00220 [Cyanobacteria bacterium J06643_13]